MARTSKLFRGLLPPSPAAGVGDPTDRGYEMSISTEEAKILAEKGTIFGYPLLLMDITRKVGTAASRPTPEASKTLINQLVNLVFLPDHTFRFVVRPNVDTMYSSTFLDLRHEPMVMSIPNTGNRYYLMQVLDAWARGGDIVCLQRGCRHICR